MRCQGTHCPDARELLSVHFVVSWYEDSTQGYLINLNSKSYRNSLIF